MLDLNDLPTIWDSELSEEEWFKVAHDEYLTIYWCVNLAINTQTPTGHRFCFKPLVDILGRVCNCTRKPDHQGPCLYLRYQLETHLDANGGHRYVMKVVDGLKYPDNYNINTNTGSWFPGGDIQVDMNTHDMVFVTNIELKVSL